LLVAASSNNFNSFSATKYTISGEFHSRSGRRVPAPAAFGSVPPGMWLEFARRNLR
jgi:hypothetical protein